MPLTPVKARELEGNHVACRMKTIVGSFGRFPTQWMSCISVIVLLGLPLAAGAQVHLVESYGGFIPDTATITVAWDPNSMDTIVDVLQVVNADRNSQPEEIIASETFPKLLENNPLLLGHSKSFRLSDAIGGQDLIDSVAQTAGTYTGIPIDRLGFPVTAEDQLRGVPVHGVHMVWITQAFAQGFPIRDPAAGISIQDPLSFTGLPTDVVFDINVSMSEPWVLKSTPGSTASLSLLGHTDIPGHATLFSLSLTNTGGVLSGQFVSDPLFGLDDVAIRTTIFNEFVPMEGGFMLPVGAFALSLDLPNFGQSAVTLGFDISNSAIVGQIVPEPATLAIWALLGGLGIWRADPRGRDPVKRI